MAIDIRQFHQTFFDETQESLVTMEVTLLDLERRLTAGAGVLDADPEALNTIFRVVHSIKGGSGTFGFGWLTDFSHALESLLEDLRAGRCRVDRKTVKLLLRSVDCLRNLLTSVRIGAEVDKTDVEGVMSEIDALHREASPETPIAPPAGNAHQGGEPTRAWRIRFTPRLGLFASGNDPLRLLRELDGLGKLHVTADTSRLPDWRDFDPEKCYLGWEIALTANVTREAIVEIFSWVTDECDLEIDALSEPDTRPNPMSTPVHDIAKAHGTSLRVSTVKMDALVDIVGELVITQTMLSQVASQLGPDEMPQLRAGLGQLERNLRELQENVMRIRMLPIGFVFSRMPRMVRDVAESLGKQVDLRMQGESTELDKTVIERISDPLLHMVRNSLDHGIETPAERRAAGKPETGVIRLSAYQRGGNVIIEIEDDGRGLATDKIIARAVERGMLSAGGKPAPEQVAELIFQPGFTTRDSVSDISGRGVGLDVVHTNICALGGNVDVTSNPGHGARFTIRMPLTLAILDGLGVEVGKHPYIIPLANITESLRPMLGQIRSLPGGDEIVAFRQEYVPIIRLAKLFGAQAPAEGNAGEIVVVVEANGRHAGLVVDDLLGQQQVVIKSLDSHYQRVEGIAAATILGDGTVAFILDIAGLVRNASVAVHQEAPSGRVAGASNHPPTNPVLH